MMAIKELRCDFFKSSEVNSTDLVSFISLLFADSNSCWYLYSYSNCVIFSMFSLLKILSFNIYTVDDSLVLFCNHQFYCKWLKVNLPRFFDGQEVLALQLLFYLSLHM